MQLVSPLNSRYKIVVVANRDTHGEGWVGKNILMCQERWWMARKEGPKPKTQNCRGMKLKKRTVFSSSSPTPILKLVIWVRRCAVRRLVRRLILHLVAAFVWFLLKDQLLSFTDSINDLGVDVTDPELWVFQWLRIYHIICKHFVVVCY